MAFRVLGLLIRQELSGVGGKASTRMISTSTVRSARILKDSPNAYLNKSLLDRFHKLKYDPKYVQATYVWIDGTGENVRLKDRVLDYVPQRRDCSLRYVPARWKANGVQQAIPDAGSLQQDQVSGTLVRY